MTAFDQPDEEFLVERLEAIEFLRDAAKRMADPETKVSTYRKVADMIVQTAQQTRENADDALVDIANSILDIQLPRDDLAYEALKSDTALYIMTRSGSIDHRVAIYDRVFDECTARLVSNFSDTANTANTYGCMLKFLNTQLPFNIAQDKYNELISEVEYDFPLAAALVQYAPVANRFNVTETHESLMHTMRVDNTLYGMVLPLQGTTQPVPQKRKIGFICGE